MEHEHELCLYWKTLLYLKLTLHKTYYNYLELGYFDNIKFLFFCQYSLKVLIGQTDGLPNLYGEITHVQFRGSGSYPDLATGVFSPLQSETFSATLGSTSSGFSSRKIIFNASNYSSIYGNSTYVRMKNLSSKIWKRIS